MNQIKNREKLLETKKNDRRENSPSENYQMVLTLCLERTTAVNGHSRLAW